MSPFGRDAAAEEDPLPITWYPVTLSLDFYAHILNKATRFQVLCAFPIVVCVCHEFMLFRSMLPISNGGLVIISYP